MKPERRRLCSGGQVFLVEGCAGVEFHDGKDHGKHSTGLMSHHGGRSLNYPICCAPIVRCKMPPIVGMDFSIVGLV